MRLKICQLSFILLFSSCDSTPEDITAGCVGSDVNIPWEYPDSAGMSTVFWEYIDSSNAATTILAQAAGSAAMVQNGYNIQHNTNGAVTILNATVANNGTYRISVAYSSATQPYTDDVVVNVYDPPTDFSFTGTPSGSQTTFTCTASSLGDPADDLYIQVNGVDMTSSVSATVPKTDTVKCILSGSSVQCMNGVSGTVTSLCVQCQTTTQPPTTTTPTTTVTTQPATLSSTTSFNLSSTSPGDTNTTPEQITDSEIIYICVGVGFPLIILISICLCLRHRRNKNKNQERPKQDNSKKENELKFSGIGPSARGSNSGQNKSKNVKSSGTNVQESEKF